MRRRRGRSSFWERPVMSWPSKITRPSVGSYRRRIVRPTVDLPHPDSPTSPSVSPRWMLSDTSSTALMSPTWRSRRMPLLIGNQTLRFSTSTRAPSCPPLVAASADNGRPRPLPLVHRHGVEAGDHVARLELAERRHLLAGLLHLVPAARLERARLRWVQHVARSALDRLELRLPLGVEAGHALQ